MEVVGGPAGGGVGGDVGTVGVGEGHVVELGEEPDRGRGAGVGPGGVGEVEQLPAGLVAEGAEAGAEPVGDLAQAGQAGPGLDVHGAGRAEGGQVAQDDPVDRGGLLDRAAEPPLGGGPGRQALLAPDAAGRDLDHRDQVVDGVGQRGRVPVGPALGHEGAELGVGPGLLVEQGPPGGEHGVDVDALDLAAEGAAGPEVPLPHRVQQRGQGQAVAGADQVDRGPHERAADHLPAGDQARPARPGRSPPGGSRGRHRGRGAPGPACPPGARPPRPPAAGPAAAGAGARAAPG